MFIQISFVDLSKQNVKIMKDLELFEKWCEMQIEAQELRRNIEISENVPKWKQLQKFGDSNAPDCYSAIKVIRLFKQQILNQTL